MNRFALGILLPALMALVVLGAPGAAPASAQPDTDNDGFDDAIESYLGTDPADNCPDNPSDDAWPLDMNMDTFVDVTHDVYSYMGNVGKSVAEYPAVQRLDLNGDGVITTVGDIWRFYDGMIGQTCNGGTPHPPPPPSEGGPVTMDIDPDITGNSANTLGVIEASAPCLVNAADMGDGLADCLIDVVVQGDTDPPVAYDVSLNYDETIVHVAPWAFKTTVAQVGGCGPGAGVTCDVADGSGFGSGDFIQFGPPNGEYLEVVSVAGNTLTLDGLISNHAQGDDVWGQQAINSLIKMPDAVIRSGEDWHPWTLDSDGTFAAGGWDHVGGAGIGGDGTLVRVGLDVIDLGSLTFSLEDPPYSAYASSQHPVTLGTAELTTDLVPVGGIAELPKVSDSAGRNYIPVAALAAAVLAALTAGGWYARRRWVR